MGGKINCNLCKSNQTICTLEGIYDSINTNLYKCQSCGVEFIHPQMTIEEEKEYYKDYYKKQEIRYAVKRNLEEIKENSYLYHLQNIDIYTNVISENSKILEIGGGTGGLIKLLKEIYPQSDFSVVERSEKNLDFLRKQEDEIPLFSDITEVKNKYNIIVAVALFEHIRNPFEFLIKLISLLSDEGYIILEMPSQRDPLIHLYKLESFINFNYQKQHYFTYNESSLQYVAEKLKLKIDRFYYPQQYGLDNHLSWLVKNKTVNFNYWTNLFKNETLNNYRNDLINNKTTDVIGVVYKK